MNKAQKKELDDLWKFVIFKKYGKKCAICGAKKYIQAHHFITRSNYRLRWDVRNGVPLCRGHHFFYAHVKPQDFEEWFITKRPKDLLYIKIAKHSQSKQDYFAIKLKLEQELEEIEREVR